MTQGRGGPGGRKVDFELFVEVGGRSGRGGLDAVGRLDRLGVGCRLGLLGLVRHDDPSLGREQRSAKRYGENVVTDADDAI